MRKIFLKNPMRTLALALLMVSAPALAGYSDDPDCVAVSNGAKRAASNIYEQVNATAANTGQSTDRTKSCVDQLLEQANRSIPDFGGGIGDLIAKLARDLMSKEACKLLSNAQSSFGSNLPAVSSVYSSQLSDLSGLGSSTAPAQAAPAAMSTLWQRLANLF